VSEPAHSTAAECQTNTFGIKRAENVFHV
jgi:hypothetical protein